MAKTGKRMSGKAWLKMMGILLGLMFCMIVVGGTVLRRAGFLPRAEAAYYTPVQQVQEAQPQQETVLTVPQSQALTVPEGNGLTVPQAQAEDGPSQSWLRRTGQLPRAGSVAPSVPQSQALQVPNNGGLTVPGAQEPTATATAVIPTATAKPMATATISPTATAQPTATPSTPEPCTPHGSGDLNGDGVVNTFDLVIISATYPELPPIEAMRKLVAVGTNYDCEYPTPNPLDPNN